MIRKVHVKTIDEKNELTKKLESKLKENVNNIAQENVTNELLQEKKSGIPLNSFKPKTVNDNDIINKNSNIEYAFASINSIKEIIKNNPINNNEISIEFVNYITNEFKLDDYNAEIVWKNNIISDMASFYNYIFVNFNKNLIKEINDRYKNILTKYISENYGKYILNTIKNPIEKYEMVNSPKHYNNYDKEVIEMIEDIWGPEKTAIWCVITAFKYRMRMGTKPDNDIQQDIEKEKWYLNKYHQLLDKIK